MENTVLDGKAAATGHRNVRRDKARRGFSSQDRNQGGALANRFKFKVSPSVPRRSM